MTRLPVVEAYLAFVTIGFALTAVGLSGWWATAGFAAWYGWKHLATRASH